MLRRAHTPCCLGALVLAVALAGGCDSEHGNQADPGASPKTRTLGNLRTVIVTADRASVFIEGIVAGTVERGRMFGVITTKGDQIKVQVCEDGDIERGWVSSSDVRYLADDDIDLGLESLKIAKAIDPSVGVDAFATQLDALAGRVAAAIPGSDVCSARASARRQQVPLRV